MTPRMIARQRGDKRYMSTRPCINGHIGEKYTASGWCVTCALEKSRSRAEYYAQYCRNNADRIRQRSHNYYIGRRDLAIELAAEWARRNPEARRAIANNYKHRRRAIEADGISGRDLLRWTRQQKKICYWCGRKCQDCFHVDHYWPLSKGGRHEATNLVIACPDCNLRKSAKSPYDFAREHGRLL